GGSAAGRDWVPGRSGAAGTEGGSGPPAVVDDTAATARELGDVTGAGLVQAAGTIGDDPAYDPANFDNPLLANPAADVDLYHFHISGPGRQTVVAEVFAGRLGSPLDPALSLFWLGPDGRLHLLASNNNTNNDSLAGNR